MVGVERVSDSDSPKYELFTESAVGFRSSLGVFDDVVFACHASTAYDLLKESQADTELVKLLGEIQYDNNVLYVHSDPKLMPKSKAA